MKAGSTGLPMLKKILNSEAQMNQFYPSCDFDRSMLNRIIANASSFHGAGVFAELNTVVQDNYDAYIFGDIDLETLLEEIQAQGTDILR